MVPSGGLRERKKRRTRDALIDAAVRLFEERGYEDTTVADIAAAADVSTRTFFLHFPTKEAVVFANSGNRLELGLEIIAAKRSNESMRRCVVRAMERMIDDTAANDLASGLGSLRVRLLIANPALQQALFARFVAAQGQFVDALQSAHPGQLDPVEAAACVGALVGAVYSAALAGVQQGGDPASLRDAMLRATHLAARCIP